MHEMDIEWFCGNEWKRKEGMGRRRAPARRIERIVVHKINEWALAGNQRVTSLSNKSEVATRKESTCMLSERVTKRHGSSWMF